MVANQKSQQDVYNELTRANRDKTNDAMFAVNQGLMMVLTEDYLKNGLTNWTKHAELVDMISGLKSLKN